ncbi:MAG: hypothetical protein C0514_04440 [Candidatus Puniceispirillum sp.]|nr:hypothetical protein [Candidatus Puniceispirillum sp.]
MSKILIALCAFLAMTAWATHEDLAQDCDAKKNVHRGVLADLPSESRLHIYLGRMPCTDGNQIADARPDQCDPFQKSGVPGVRSVARAFVCRDQRVCLFEGYRNLGHFYLKKGLMCEAREAFHTAISQGSHAVCAKEVEAVRACLMKHGLRR